MNWKKIDKNLTNMKPGQQVISDIFCENSHYLTTIKVTPFSIIDIKVKCKMCGCVAEGKDLTLALELKKQ